MTILVMISRNTGEEGRYSFPSETKAEEFVREASSLAKEAGTEIAVRTMTEEEGLQERFDSLVDQWNVVGKTKRAYKSVTRKFGKWLKQHSKSLLNFTSQDIHKWLATLNVSNGTKSHYKGIIERFGLYR